MIETMWTKPTLVLGGTGKTGRRIVDPLTARGVPVRVGSRSAPIPFDWEDETTWAPVLDGVRAAYISYFPDLSIPGAPEAVRAFAELALDQGVRRLVLLSGRGEEEAQRSERAVQETAPTSRSCAAPGSCRTSARMARSSTERSSCPQTSSWNRSSMPTTSLTWRWQR